MTTGTLYSYTDTGIVKRSIADLINMIDWQEAPLLKLFGFTNANMKKFKLVNWPQTKAELNEDTMPAISTLLTEDLDNSETGVDVTASTGQYFRQGDVVGVYLSGQVAEYMLVTSVSTDTLTVTRAYGTTPAATTHLTGATLTRVTRAMPEGADYTTGYTTTTTQPYNYTQIISEAAKVTKTNQTISKYGIEDMMDYQVAKLISEGGQAGVLPQMLQRIFYHGKRVLRSASAYGSAGGFELFVTTNLTDLNGAAIQKSDIHTVLRQIRDAGGRATHLVTGSWGIEKITSMYEDFITTERDETIGGAEIQAVLTPHGKVKLVYDWMCPQDRYYFVNADKVGWLPLREFNTTPIAEQGDYFVKDVVGEYTFLVSNEKSHGLIREASTTT